MMVVPNPSWAEAELMWKNFHNVDVRILNAQGQTVGGVRVSSENTKLPSLASGLYHLVTEEEYPQSAKWVVLQPTP